MPNGEGGKRIFEGIKRDLFQVYGIKVSHTKTGSVAIVAKGLDMPRSVRSRLRRAVETLEYATGKLPEPEQLVVRENRSPKAPVPAPVP